MSDDRLDRLRQELAQPLPHPDAPALRQAGEQTLAWFLQHFATLPDQPIGRTGSRAELEALLAGPAPEQGQDFATVLHEFEQKIAPFAFRVNHPRFLAFIPSAPSFPSVLGDWLCSGANFFAGVWLEAAGPAEVELVVLDWFRTFLGMPAGTRGILTSGGSEANLSGLLVARDRLSFADRGRAVLYASDHRHHSIDRAVRVIGLHPEQIRTLPADAGFRLRPEALHSAIRQDRAAGREPWTVVAIAGTTSTGAVDPLPALADICQAEKLWLHVDAAYGWPAVLVPEGQALLAGIERADSIAFDPHKWFAQTFEAGCLLVRDGQRLFDTFATHADYMKDVEAGADEINFADHGLALTRRFRALKIWLSVKGLGLGWFRDLVRHCCRLAEFAQLLLENTGEFEILSPRQLSIIAFRYRPAGIGADRLEAINRELLSRLRSGGRAFLSSTRLDGRLALRLCFINWRTRAADVEEIVRLLSRYGQEAS